MKIGLIDVDSHNFPNLPLMKISAYHKRKGDSVEFYNPLEHYEKVYVSKVFGAEYTKDFPFVINADEIEFGGTGYAITIENGKEIYHKDRDKNLPYEIEHIYPDYSLYPEYTKDTAYGFLTRGCCNNCSFCIVSAKEGLCSQKVADLSEWWNGQKNIVLLDANILACKDRLSLLEQLRKSNAVVDYTQGLDARFITEEIANAILRTKYKEIHFAFDFMKNEKQIVNGLKTFMQVKNNSYQPIVYMLTNYDTTIIEDIRRIKLIQQCGCKPDVRIYRKNTAMQITRDLQRWCNNRLLYGATSFDDYIPRADGKSIKEIYRKFYI